MTTKRRSKAVSHANQYLLDPRQLTCWNYYIDPKSESWANAMKSAIRAGYTEANAGQITTEKWWLERIRRLNMLSKAERNLDEFLDLPSETQAMGAFGPLFKSKTTKVKGKDGKVKTKRIVDETKPIMVLNTGLLAIKQRTTEFIAERVGRKRYGTKETPGGNTYNIAIFQDGQRTRIAKRIIGGGSTGDRSSQN